MEEKRAKNTLLSWPTLLLVTAAASGLVWWQTPLTSSRPGGHSRHEHLLIGDQSVEARLWQDPFTAVQHHEQEHRDAASSASKGGGSVSNSLGQLTEQITRFYEAAGTYPVIQIMPVMVSGGPYTEDSESRLRSRHAVISALGVAGYAPENAEAIGYFRLACPSGKRLLSTPGMEADPPAQSDLLTVPFEWFGRRRFQGPRADATARIDKVLVLWLKEDASSHHPPPTSCSCCSRQ